MRKERNRYFSKPSSLTTNANFSIAKSKSSLECSAVIMTHGTENGGHILPDRTAVEAGAVVLACKADLQLSYR